MLKLHIHTSQTANSMDLKIKLLMAHLGILSFLWSSRSCHSWKGQYHAQYCSTEIHDQLLNLTAIWEAGQGSEQWDLALNN